MKRVSDERLEQLREYYQDEADEYADSKRHGKREAHTAALIAELQAWRAAFKGVEMVVPVEWVNVEMNILRTSSEKVKLAYTDSDGEDDLWCEQLFGVIRLDEIFGTEGTK